MIFMKSQETKECKPTIQSLQEEIEKFQEEMAYHKKMYHTHLYWKHPEQPCLNKYIHYSDLFDILLDHLGIKIEDWPDRAPYKVVKQGKRKEKIDE